MQYRSGRRNEIESSEKGAVTYAKAYIKTVCYSLALTFPMAVALHLVCGVVPHSCSGRIGFETGTVATPVLPLA
jgi:hypothetical protein